MKRAITYDGNAVSITVNRPRVANTMNLPAIDDLERHAVAVAGEGRANVVVLEGRGKK